jgi:hypothetical protein
MVRRETMKAKAITDAIVVSASHIIEGETILETSCSDFEHFCSLPSVVVFEGRVCGKSAWSSDTNRACYKSGMRVAYAVKA